MNIYSTPCGSDVVSSICEELVEQSITQKLIIVSIANGESKLVYFIRHTKTPPIID